MPLPTGSRLGPYEIVSPLGAGGMEEVYRMGDTRLNRAARRRYGSFERSQCVPMPSAFADRAKVASAVATRNPSDAATAR